MIILGIDPGIAIVGWGVVDYTGGKFKTLGYGAIKTPSEDAPDVRLAEIYNKLSAIIDRYNPDTMAVEELFFNTNITTAIPVAEARGVILLCGRLRNIEFAEYTPLQIKQTVTGYGRADKVQMITMVTTLLGLPEPPKPDDTADALAVAICHAYSGASVLGQYYNKTVISGKGVARKSHDKRIIEGTNIVKPKKRHVIKNGENDK